VDFVIYGLNVFVACEVKNGAIISPSDLRGLKEFHKDYPEAELLLLYRGKETFKRDGVLCIPAEEFLRRLDPLSETLIPT